MTQRATFEELAAARAGGAELVLASAAWSPSVRARAEAALAAARAAGRLGDGTIVTFSSGSTGDPKGIVRTHASWEATVPALSEASGIGPADVVALPGPLSSSLFAYGAWHAAAVGAQVRLEGEDAADATAVHCVPLQLREIVAARRRGRRRALRVAVVAGDRLGDALRAEAEDLGLRVLEYYGAAELSFIGLAQAAGPMRPFPGVECEIRDGVLWSRSPYAMTAYLDETRGGSLRTDGAWRSAGDLAEEVPGGYLLRGRGDLAVTTGGHTVAVEEVERGLREVDGVRDAAAVGLEHPRLGQLLAVAVATDLGVEAVRAAVRTWPGPARPRRIAVVPELPRLASGKVDRLAVAALLRKAGRG